MSDFWLALWQECRRLAARVGMRGQLAVLGRQIARAERLLGELAWQQADYAEGDSQARALQTVEQREAHLLFEIGETNEQIATLSAALAEENARALQEIAAAETLAAAAEQRALAHIKTLNVETTLGSPDFVLRRIQKALETEEDALLELRDALQQRKNAAEETRAKNTVVLNELRSALKRLQIERSQLQRKKGGHYRNIGQELADAQIAPLNQPETLARVLLLREKTRQLQAAVAASQVDSQAASFAARLFAKMGIVLSLSVAAFFLVHWLRA